MDRAEGWRSCREKGLSDIIARKFFVRMNVMDNLSIPRRIIKGVK